MVVSNQPRDPEKYQSMKPPRSQIRCMKLYQTAPWTADVELSSVAAALWQLLGWRAGGAMDDRDEDVERIPKK